MNRNNWKTLCLHHHRCALFTARHPSAYSLRHKRNTISMSSAAEKAMAMSTPQSTETKTEAGDSGQVAAQTNPAPPMAQTEKDKALRRNTLLNIATLLVMLVLSLTMSQSLTQMYSVPAIIPMILLVSSQVLILTAAFL